MFKQYLRLFEEAENMGFDDLGNQNQCPFQPFSAKN
jgi:hypothetical protein